ncbi:hypothetical protein SAMN02746066_03460 [Anaerosporobacter mobilis DSM 15930]|jgi:hypothetical protein|uniref:Lipoprotein n=1 Tax=Anaerosporobacter mobilis DSM 15930 TaxID=1120996 RepID=A0A1M7LW50_9FIRM|nr:hypothetical protein [Anaerosporobacter mobilis]SHM82576.1 hypothetical protein SAMN02746066_03460 [Anaerosporobacter mobilis DSM 15930]
MKKNLVFFICFIQVMLLIGCSFNNQNEPSQEETVSNENDTFIYKDPSQDLTNGSQGITYCSDFKEYTLLDMSLDKSYHKIIKKFGEPLEQGYDVVGTFHITDQSLYTYMYYSNMLIITRDFFDENDTKENSIIEIDINGGDYETLKGVKIGDSLDTVSKLYDINFIFPYEKESSNEIVNMIYNRINGAEYYTNRFMFYDYGTVDKIAYIISDIKDEEHNSIPALIFLFNNDKVTHIILYNTLAL